MQVSVRESYSARNTSFSVGRFLHVLSRTNLFIVLRVEFLFPMIMMPCLPPKNVYSRILISSKAVQNGIPSRSAAQCNCPMFAARSMPGHCFPPNFLNYFQRGIAWVSPATLTRPYFHRSGVTLSRSKSRTRSKQSATWKSKGSTARMLNSISLRGSRSRCRVLPIG